VWKKREGSNTLKLGVRRIGSVCYKISLIGDFVKRGIKSLGGEDGVRKVCQLTFYSLQKERKIQEKCKNSAGRARVVSPVEKRNKGAGNEEREKKAGGPGVQRPLTNSRRGQSGSATEKIQNSNN